MYLYNPYMGVASPRQPSLILLSETQFVRLCMAWITVTRSVKCIHLPLPRSIFFKVNIGHGTIAEDQQYVMQIVLPRCCGSNSL